MYSILYIMCSILSIGQRGIMDVNDVIANNLKILREEMKLSLDSVAKLTGVSKSMLGQIERGEVNPTISVLWKIANGLKISFTTLLEMPESETNVIKAGDIKPLVEDGGRFINHPVFAFDENKRFETYRITIVHGGHSDSLAHLTGTKEYITLFSGSVVITVNQQEYPLGKGDSICFKADAPHSYRNDGQDTAELSMVIHYDK